MHTEGINELNVILQNNTNIEVRNIINYTLQEESGL